MSYNINDLPPEIVDNVIWNLEFTPLFKAVRHIPIFEQVWLTYTLTGHHQRLQNSRELEDQYLYNSMSIWEKELVHRIAEEAASATAYVNSFFVGRADKLKHLSLREELEEGFKACSVPPKLATEILKVLSTSAEITKRTHLSTAIHLVHMANSGRQFGRSRPDIKVEGNLTWVNASMLKHLKNVSTIRLLDLSHKISSLDAYLKASFDYEYCESQGECPSIWHCVHNDVRSARLGIVGNIQAWLEHTIMIRSKQSTYIDRASQEQINRTEGYIYSRVAGRLSAAAGGNLGSIDVIDDVILNRYLRRYQNYWEAYKDAMSEIREANMGTEFERYYAGFWDFVCPSIDRDLKCRLNNSFGYLLFGFVP